ncbi:protoporphyrinogen oxidase [Roseisolibacter sp. H3M3-2]|uniref:protoporphyrinogen oxidase n=1 Tax=Roseisolibacter sp. H3M3-2 TaxID=3031323 RepID=UPI0023D98866|nr:protoporphyrinogen oxidase [Roseisolibacter sp. H3M3-2]MDF1502397.1 protoporphyrinogen oxidase [Roseisolibacter sp. H3M3-2]
MRRPSDVPGPDRPARHVLVVGGGISGLAAAESLIRGDARVRVTVVEATHRLGGIVGTERADGFVMERGPDVVVAAKPATRALAERVGVADRLTATSVRGAYVYRGGTLRRLPAGLSGLMPTRLRPLATSRLLSAKGLLRVASEPWRGSGAMRDGHDESLEAFVVRRMGREAYDRLVEPLLTGIYAGDGARLSLAATFPQLRDLEREHGSLLRGIRARSAAAPAGAADQSPFLSFKEGMEELVEGVARHLAASGRVAFRTGAAARSLRAPGVGGPALTLADGTTLAGDAVVLALPARATAALLAPIDADLARELRAIPHGSTATVTLAVPAADVPRTLDATGYVVPRAESRAVLACTWASSKLAGRAPAGMALFRLFFGGARRPELAVRDDDHLVGLARAELREVLGVTAAPRLSRVTRWLDAMPQYELGHAARVAAVEQRAGALPWLALAGNAYHGVGVPDCIRSGEQAAARVRAHLAVAPAESYLHGLAQGA